MRDDDDVSVCSERQPTAFDTTRQVPTSICDFFVFVYFLLNGVEQPFFDQTWQLPLFTPIDFTNTATRSIRTDHHNESTNP